MGYVKLDQEREDEIIYKAVRFLIDGEEFSDARMILACDIDIHQHRYTNYDPDIGEMIIQGRLRITITGHRSVYDELKYINDYSNDSNIIHHHPIINAFDTTTGYCDYRIQVSVDSNVSPGWREHLQLLAENEGVEASNQGVRAEEGKYFKVWNNLKFRSTSETRIAEALDKRAVLYLPNCRARMGYKNDRQNREADFLVCHKGKWGILEVDGPHHTGRAAQDHDRDRLFKQHGIMVAEHFSSDECFQNADRVVSQFLNILENAK